MSSVMEIAMKDMGYLIELAQANMKYLPGPVANVMGYGARGDGIADDTAAIQKAMDSGDSVFFPGGTYLIQGSLTFDSPVQFTNGAVLKIRNGAVVTFNSNVDAGLYQIADTLDNFITTPTANTSVVFKKQRVKAEWLGAVAVSDFADIKTIPDQTGNLIKALRAAMGNYSIAVGTNFNSDNPQGILELGYGYYRVDGSLSIGHLAPGPVFYRMNGSGIVGQGPASTFLVRTDLASTAVVLNFNFYTSELTLCRDLKVTAYDPDAVSNHFSSAAETMAFFQGDSIQINNIWVSGGQVAVVDSNGVSRNGVGIQFESCVDTFGTDIFVELCVTNIAISSSYVSLSNITSYGSSVQNIGIGNYRASWPDSQLTGSKVNITNIESKACGFYWMNVLSKGENHVDISNIKANGVQEGTGISIGTDIIHLEQAALLHGSIRGAEFLQFTRSILIGLAGSLPGTEGQILALSDWKIEKMNGVYPGVAAIDTSVGFNANLVCQRLSFQDCVPMLVTSKYKVVLEDIALKDYQGVPDTGANRQLFAQVDGDLTLNRITRSTSDTVALNQFGFQAAGKAYIDIRDLPNATRAVSGSGTVNMPSYVAFA